MSHYERTGSIIEATLVDLYSLPFDDLALLQLAQQNNGNVLTVEGNYGAGIGAAVASALAERSRAFTFKQIFVRHIPKSGCTPDEVLRYLQLSAEDIVRTAVGMLAVASRYLGSHVNAYDLDSSHVDERTAGD